MKHFTIIEDKVYEIPEQLVGFDFIKGNSSWVAYVGYNKDTMQLFVQSHYVNPFNKGEVFYDVLEMAWEQFTKRINSAGYTFESYVKGFYSNETVDWVIKETTVRDLLICYNNCLQLTAK